MAEQDSANPWDWLNPRDAARFGEAMNDPAERARWSAIMLTGGLPMLWKRSAKPARDMMFNKMELRKGANVLLIGEGLEECGFTAEIRSHIGEEGSITAFELIEEARNASLALKYGRGGQLGTWQWTYTHGDPDNYYDTIACLQGVQHTDDWREAATEFARVGKPGAMIVLGELTIGPNFKHAMKSDVHLEYYIEKLFRGLGMSGVELAYYSPEELREAFAGLVVDMEAFEWRGVELFWGRKPRMP